MANQLEGKFYIGRMHWSAQIAHSEVNKTLSSSIENAIIIEDQVRLVGFQSNGSYFKTSPLKSMKSDENGYVFVTTSGSIYLVKFEDFLHVTNFKDLQEFYHDKINILSLYPLIRQECDAAGPQLNSQRSYYFRHLEIKDFINIDSNFTEAIKLQKSQP